MENFPSGLKFALSVFSKNLVPIVIAIFAACSHIATLEDEKESLMTKLRLVRHDLDNAKPTAAWDNLQPLLKAHEENADVLNFAGLTMLALRNAKRAIYFFRKAYAASPSTAIGLNISSALLAAGDYRGAKTVLNNLQKKGLKDYSYRERIWHNIALIYDKEGNNNMAIKYYLKALDENPTFYLSCLQLGRLYKKIKQEQNSIRYYSKAQVSCPSCFEPVKALSNIWLTTNNSSEAVKMLKAYLQGKQIQKESRQQAYELLQIATKLNKLNNLKR